MLDIVHVVKQTCEGNIDNLSIRNVLPPYLTHTKCVLMNKLCKKSKGFCIYSVIKTVVLDK